MAKKNKNAGMKIITEGEKDYVVQKEDEMGGTAAEYKPAEKIKYRVCPFCHRPIYMEAENCPYCLAKLEESHE